MQQRAKRIKLRTLNDAVRLLHDQQRRQRAERSGKPHAELETRAQLIDFYRAKILKLHVLHQHLRPRLRIDRRHVEHFEERHRDILHHAESRQQKRSGKDVTAQRIPDVHQFRMVHLRNRLILENDLAGIRQFQQPQQPEDQVFSTSRFTRKQRD